MPRPKHYNVKEKPKPLSIEEVSAHDFREDPEFAFFVKRVRQTIRRLRNATAGAIVRAGIRDHYRLSLALEELLGAGEITQGGAVLAPTYSVTRGKR